MSWAKLSHGSQAHSSPGDPPLERRSPGQVGQALLVELKACARSSPHLLAKPTGTGSEVPAGGCAGEADIGSKAANQANSEQLFATYLGGGQDTMCRTTTRRSAPIHWSPIGIRHRPERRRRGDGADLSHEHAPLKPPPPGVKRATLHHLQVKTRKCASYCRVNKAIRSPFSVLVTGHCLACFRGSLGEPPATAV